MAGELCRIEGFATLGKGEALPAGAVAIVRLEEHGIADKAAEVLGEARMDVGGYRAPLPFSLTADCASLRAAHMPAFAIRIEKDGRLLYVNDTHHPYRASTHRHRVELVPVGG